MNNKLKTCPFCKSGKGYECIVGSNNYFWYYIQCGTCFAKTGDYADICKAIAAWNRRAQPDNEPLTLEEYQAIGDWVWCKNIVGEPKSGWYEKKYLDKFADITIYGKTWLAYRSKPEEG